MPRGDRLLPRNPYLPPLPAMRPGMEQKLIPVEQPDRPQLAQIPAAPADKTALAQALLRGASGPARGWGDALSQVVDTWSANRMLGKQHEAETQRQDALFQALTGTDDPEQQAMIALQGGDDSLFKALAGHRLQQKLNPPDPRDSQLKDYQLEAARLGLQPKSKLLSPEEEQQQLRLRRAGASSVTVGGGEVGTIPQGYELFTDKQSGGRSLRPIPGGPVAADQEAAAMAQDAVQAGKDTQQSVVLGAIQRLKKSLDEDSIFNPAVGFGAETAAQYGGTRAKDASALIDTIVSNIGFDQLQKMREASPTGGALGQVTEKELKFLQSVQGSLAQGQSEPQFRQTLDEIERIMTKAAAYPNAGNFGFGAGQEIQGDASLDDLLKKYGN